MIKILNEEEKLKTKKLWSQVFIEDSKNFVDYYYSIKTKNNIIFAKIINQEIVSMLHLNPYELNFNNKMIKSYYIVGVATSPENRKKGYMRELIQESLNYLNKKNVEFTFLMPAKKEIYLPFDFRFIYDQKYLSLKENTNLKKVPASPKDYNLISNFLNEKLKKEYNLFIIRSIEYIKNLHLELKSEQGDIIMLYNNNELVGLYLYWGVKKQETRSIYSDERYTNLIKTEPKIMARIVNINSFLTKIYTSSSSEKTFYLNIKDNIIKENNGFFKWTVSKDKSILCKCENNENSITIDISDLTSLLFDYVTLDDLLLEEKITYNNKNALADLSLINPIKKVFLDEIV